MYTCDTRREKKLRWPGWWNNETWNDETMKLLMIFCPRLKTVRSENELFGQLHRLYRLDVLVKQCALLSIVVLFQKNKPGKLQRLPPYLECDFEKKFSDFILGTFPENWKLLAPCRGSSTNQLPISNSTFPWMPDYTSVLVIFNAFLFILCLGWHFYSRKLPPNPPYEETVPVNPLTSSSGKEKEIELTNNPLNKNKIS